MNPLLWLMIWLLPSMQCQLNVCVLAKRIPEIYESVVQKKTKNDELLSHLFMSYVKTEDYKKQQQTALSLYKVIPSNPYYLWAVMSIVMQVSNWIFVNKKFGLFCIPSRTLIRGRGILPTVSRKDVREIYQRKEAEFCSRSVSLRLVTGDAWICCTVAGTHTR